MSSRMQQAQTVARKLPDTDGLLSLTRVPDAMQSKKNVVLIEAGELPPGEYACRIYTTEMTTLEVNLRPSSVVGAFAPTLRTCWLADNSDRDTDAGVNFVDDTNQELTLTPLLGQRFAELVFTVPPGGAITFDRAEFNGL